MRRSLVLLFAVANVVVACSTEPGATQSAAPSFTVDGPATGSVVSISPIEVTGTAQAGARIVRDVPLAPDDDVIAGTNGRWSMNVELDEGANELVFRLGDDESTEVRIGLTYDPGVAQTATPPSPSTPP